MSFGPVEDSTSGKRVLGAIFVFYDDHSCSTKEKIYRSLLVGIRSLSDRRRQRSLP